MPPLAGHTATALLGAVCGRAVQSLWKGVSARPPLHEDPAEAQSAPSDEEAADLGFVGWVLLPHRQEAHRLLPSQSWLLSSLPRN